MELLSKSFIPVAVDEWYHARRKDHEGDFYRKVVFQREGLKEGRTTQGFYIFASDGTLLKGWNNRDVPKMRRYLEAALKDYVPPKTEDLKGKVDKNFRRQLPEGGLVVDVFSSILEANWGEPKDEWAKVFRTAMGRDHLWMTKPEVEALAGGSMPESLTTRIVRFHLIDNTRGEPPMWQPGEVRESKWALKDGVLSGSVKLATDDKKRGYDAQFYGIVEAKDAAITRFDLVVKGQFWGEGTYTQGAPPGKFILAVAFTLAREGEASKVPPQGARDFREYLGR